MSVAAKEYYLFKTFSALLYVGAFCVLFVLMKTSIISYNINKYKSVSFIFYRILVYFSGVIKFKKRLETNTYTYKKSNENTSPIRLKK